MSRPEDFYTGEFSCKCRGIIRIKIYIPYIFADKAKMIKICSKCGTRYQLSGEIKSDETGVHKILRVQDTKNITEAENIKESEETKNDL